MLYVSPDRPVDPLTLAVLEVVASVAGKLDLPWFVAGAMVRNIVLTGVFGLDSGRATRDIDLAVAVADWEQFVELKRQLLSTGHFQEIKGVPHKLNYKRAADNSGYPFDIIPFGGVEGKSQSITWPPDMNEIMSVAGYKEAYATAVEVEVQPGLIARVASLPGLAVLKIFVWHDRGREDPRDAIDLATLFRRYADAGNMERLYGSAISVLQDVDYQLQLAGPRLLGCDVRATFSASTVERAREIISKNEDRLITDIARGLLNANESVAEAELLLEQFRAGLEGR